MSKISWACHKRGLVVSVVAEKMRRDVVMPSQTVRDGDSAQVESQELSLLLPLHRIQRKTVIDQQLLCHLSLQKAFGKKCMSVSKKLGGEVKLPFSANERAPFVTPCCIYPNSLFLRTKTGCEEAQIAIILVCLGLFYRNAYQQCEIWLLRVGRVLQAASRIGRLHYSQRITGKKSTYVL